MDMIYYASDKIVEYPAIRIDKTTKDFSWGFYAMESEQLAKETAVSTDTIINSYSLKNIESLRVKRFDGYTHEWLDFVMNCRSGHTHGYDIVIGGKADETIYEYMEAYKAGEMNEEKFLNEMKEKYPNQQISFHTIRALDCVEFVRAQE